MKRWMAIAGPIIFLFSCAWMYLMMEVHDSDRAPRPTSFPYAAKLHSVIDTIDKEFKTLEDDHRALRKQLATAMANNPKLAGVLGAARDAAASITTAAAFPTAEPTAVQQQQKQQEPAGAAVAAPLVDAKLKFVQPVTTADVCVATNAVPSKTDTEMADFLEKEDFTDIDGGVWKQGFDLSYTMSDFEKEPLHVFVVPHSHNDPGWLKTVEGYYDAQTRSILNNIVNFLSDNANRKFIWAEMSYLSMWWSEQGADMKEKFRKLVRNKQLEIVTGGWVMNDEANTHYYAMVDQMIEGHEWIKHNVGEGIIPSSGWAIDPFGHSPAMAYILKRMKFDFMLIQRTHYIVKKQFSRQKSLEFKWRQPWDTSDSTDILTHMMPFYSYDVPHTCGPDPKVCCQFDFRRLAGGKMTCPWRVNPQVISDSNVESRAEMLLDQYRKKSRLFRTNVLLVPLGDDFRYDLAMDAQNQFSNYEALMKYINNNPSMKAKVEFGTLNDYYTALVKQAGKDASGLPKGFPAVRGDFFTYTDRNQDYWSGYFTSRPFYKNLDRVLESALRASELLFSVSHALSAQASNKVDFDSRAAFKQLVQARRTLGLFQHHDGITGTARTAVVVDYGQKLITAYRGAMDLMKNSVAAFLQSKAAVKVTLSVTSSRAAHDSLEVMTWIEMASAPRLVTVYNPLAKSRTTVVRLLVDDRNLDVIDADGKPVPFQLSPSWAAADKVDKLGFELLIKVQVLPLGVTCLLLRKATSAAPLASTTLHHSSTSADQERDIKVADPGAFTVENSQYKLSFTPSGMLKSVFSKSSQSSTDVAIKFYTYGSTVRPGHKPGAYLFFPSGAAEPHAESARPIVRVTRGSLCSEVTVHWPQITHVLRIYNIEGLESYGIDIENVVDITPHDQKELIMRLETGIKPAESVYFSDLNGFTMQRRKYLGKLPTQGNFYPLPSMAFLEDSKRRLSLASGQPLGSASLQPGWLEVVLDRRLMQDDDRGLGQPVTDNKPTKSVFRLLLEEKAQASDPPAAAAHPTLMANLLAELFMHRSISYVSSGAFSDPHIPAALSGVSPTGLACNLFMVNLRTLEDTSDMEPAKRRALLIHNKAYDCRFPVPLYCMASGSTSEVTLSSLFSGLKLSSAENVSLSLAHRHGAVSTTSPISIRPLEIEALKLDM